MPDLTAATLRQLIEAANNSTDLESLDVANVRLGAALRNHADQFLRLLEADEGRQRTANCGVCKGEGVVLNIDWAWGHYREDRVPCPSCKGGAT